MRRLWPLFWLLVLFAGGLRPLAAETLTFGIVPQQSAKKLARLWTPVLRDLGERSGHEVVFATAKNIPTFERRVRDGQYDVAYMNPYHFVRFSDAPGYRALARQRDKRIRGIIVAKKSAGIASLDKLADATLAFPAPAAFAASILTRGELGSRGVPFSPQYVSSHDSVYLGVARGMFLAGGGVMRTFNNAPEAVRNQLEVIWTTGPYTPHAIATRPGMLDSTRADLRRALLEMNESPESLERLASIKFKGFEIASSQDWDDVRGLNLNTLLAD
ncbi:MAG: phosphate/phosphite/phosphonate ABC transporter substrate-binding protein [Pseudomonadota bacterium]